MSEYQLEEQYWHQHNLNKIKTKMEDAVQEDREWSYQGENFKVDLSVTLFPILMLLGKIDNKHLFR